MPAGACLNQPVVTEDTIFATGESRLHAVQRATGRNRWPTIDVRRTVNGLTDAGAVLVGMTNGSLMAFAKDSGRTVWEIAGEYTDTAPSMAVAGNVLYFQGSPNTKPAAKARGTLHALDLDTRAILWSFSRPTAEANWAFGWVTAVNGGLWVDSYQALVKLE